MSRHTAKLASDAIAERAAEKAVRALIAAPLVKVVPMWPQEKRVMGEKRKYTHRKVRSPYQPMARWLEMRL